MEEKSLVSQAAKKVNVGMFNGLVGLAKQNPVITTVTVLGTVAAAVSGVVYLQSSGFFKDFRSSRISVNRNGIETNPEHTTNIEAGNITTEGPNDVLALGANPQIRTGNIQAGQGGNQLHAIDSGTSAETFEAVNRLRNRPANSR